MDSSVPISASGSDSGERGASSHDEEVSLLDLLVVLARQRAIIMWTTFIITAVGLTYAIVVPAEYTSSARVVRESQAEGRLNLPGGITSGMLSGLGIGLGGSSSGLTPQAFPDVLNSREVQLSVVQDTFFFPDAERRMTLVEYESRSRGPIGTVFKYTIGLPWTLKRGFGDLISETPAPPGTMASGVRIRPTEAQDDALEALDEMVSTSVDPETGLMTISVAAEGPYLASNIAQSLVAHLMTRVREIRTKKVRERLEFVKDRFEDVEKELEAAEDRLATFLERNQNPSTATLQFREERLQRQVRFKEQLYSELQGQLTQARLDLQRRQPVVTVVEGPVPPVERSAPRRTVIVIVSLLFGGFFGVVLAFVRTFFQRHTEIAEEREKVEEVREAFVPGRFLNWLHAWWTSSNE